jgi:lysophospholipase L1-like esterase
MHTGAADLLSVDSAATVQSDVEALIDKFRVGKADVPILLLGFYEPNDISGHTATYAEFKAALAAAAQSRACAYLDLRPIIGKLTPGSQYNAGDGTHTNEAGQTLMGDAIASHLLVPVYGI